MSDALRVRKSFVGKNEEKPRAFARGIRSRLLTLGSPIRFRHQHAKAYGGQESVLFQHSGHPTLVLEFKGHKTRKPRLRLRFAGSLPLR